MLIVNLSVSVRLTKSCFSDGELWSNRGNNLVVSLLQRRYPALCDPSSLEQVVTLLYTPGALASHQDPEMEERVAALSEEELSGGAGLTETERGRLLCYLTSQIMTDLPGGHCMPLPTASFRLPWTKN